MTLTYLGDLTSLVYTSEQKEPLGESDLGSILESSRRHNRTNEITGLLVYVRGHFLQVLEGPDSSVQATMRRIEADRRHHRLNVVLSMRIPERHFGVWSMAFPKVEELTEELLRKYSFTCPEKPFPQIGRLQVLRVLSNFRAATAWPVE